MPAVSWPSTTFSSLARAGWGTGPVGPHPLGLEPSTAKPSPGFENWRLAQTAGTAE